MNKIDLKRWESELGDPTWYRRIVPDLRALVALRETQRDVYEKGKESVYDFFKRHLRDGSIALGSTGKNWDAERKPIDTVVIHHTSMAPGLGLLRLSAVELVRLYAPQYAAPRYQVDAEITGRPIYSGHFRGGTQVFWPYHWLVRSDGSVEQLLTDDETGWHAGNWEVNCRSVVVCFDGDFEYGRPGDMELAAAARVIREQYPQVTTARILGHCEVNEKRTCPSTLFLPREGRGWKEELLALP